MRDRQQPLITPEAVALDLDHAGVGSRFVAQIIDGTLLTVVLILVFVAALAIESASGSGGIVLVGALLAMFLVSTLYNTLFELFWDGQTPGKRTQSVRVVCSDGQPLTGTRAVVRNVLRFVDGLFLGAVGVASIFLTRDNQRLGDLAAGTIVVHDRDARPSVTPLGQLRMAPWAEHLDVSAVNERQFALARQFLQRREELHLNARIQVGQQVSGSLRDVVPGIPVGAEDELVIESILAAIRARNAPPVTS